MGKVIDLTGRRFGRLIVLRQAPTRTMSSGRRICWYCKCDCGSIEIKVGANLTSGSTKSCGCLATDSSIKNLNSAIKNNRKHSLSNSKLYHSWEHMIGRCTNKQEPNYPDYGGRGIIVTDEWKNFSIFSKWATESGYKEHLTIERIDVDGNYEPSNCRWISKSEQAWNQRPQRRSKTGVRGVLKRGNKYQAMIGVKGKRHYLGLFNTLEEAATVKKEAEERLWVSAT